MSMSYLGGISFELYLAHIMVNQVYQLTFLYQEGNLVEYLGVLVVAVLIVDLAGKATTKITKRILKPIPQHVAHA